MNFPHDLSYLQSLPADFGGLISMGAEICWYLNHILSVSLFAVGVGLGGIFAVAWKG